MTKQPHQLTITHKPLDAPGVRVARPGDAPAYDVDITALQDIITGLDGDLDNISGKPDIIAVRDALHSVIVAVQDLTQLTINTHRGIADGHLNYIDD